MLPWCQACEICTPAFVTTAVKSTNPLYFVPRNHLCAKYIDQTISNAFIIPGWGLVHNKPSAYEISPVLFAGKSPQMQIFGVTGESLGTIGAKAEDRQEPQWKRILNAKPSVSIRKGIAWVRNL
jgi:hypothetical protein